MPRKYIEIADNSGCLFASEIPPNVKNPYQMDGDCKVDGVTYYMKAWILRDKRGRKMLSFNFVKKKFQPTQEHAGNNHLLKTTTVKKKPLHFSRGDDLEAINERLERQRNR